MDDRGSPGLTAGTAHPPQTQEVGACPVCGRRDAKFLFASPDHMHGVPGTYSYRRCRACRTVFQDPRVVDECLGLLYPGSYYTHRAGDPVASPRTRGSEAGIREKIRSAVQRARAPHAGEEGPPWWGRAMASVRWVRERAFFDLLDDEMLPWRTPAGRALDVGCGSGFWMARLAAVGWEVFGAEPDAAAAAVARERTGAVVHVAPADALRPAELGNFDLITLFHVLEHLSAPGRVLRTLASLLRPGGRLVMLWPNPDALGARIFGRNWFGWDAPRHLVLPSLRALHPLLEHTGLALRRARTFTRSAADYAMQSASYRRGRGFRSGAPGLPHRCLGAVECALVALRLDVGEELLLHLELRG